MMIIIVKNGFRGSLHHPYSHISSWCSIMYFKSIRKNWRLCLKLLFAHTSWAFLACATRSLTCQINFNNSFSQNTPRSYTHVMYVDISNLTRRQRREISQVFHGCRLIALNFFVWLLCPPSRRYLHSNQI